MQVNLACFQQWCLSYPPSDVTELLEGFSTVFFSKNWKSSQCKGTSPSFQRRTFFRRSATGHHQLLWRSRCWSTKPSQPKRRGSRVGTNFHYDDYFDYNIIASEESSECFNPLNANSERGLEWLGKLVLFSFGRFVSCDVPVVFIWAFRHNFAFQQFAGFGLVEKGVRARFKFNSFVFFELDLKLSKWNILDGWVIELFSSLFRGTFFEKLTKELTGSGLDLNSTGN